jgi:hypothetical protein
LDIGKEVILIEKDGKKEVGFFVGSWDNKDWFWNVTAHTIMWRVPETRECIAAPIGSKVLAADYSQIEVKLMAFLSQDPGLLKALNSVDSSGNPTDIHTYMAAEVYGIKLGFTYDEMILIINGKAEGGKNHPRYTELKVLRTNIKTTTFGVPYGAGAETIARQTGLTVEQAQKLIDDYFGRFPVLKEWIDNQGDMAIKQGYTSTPAPHGRKRFYTMPPRTSEKYDMDISQIRRWAGNHPIQGCLIGNSRIMVKGEGYTTISSQEDKQISIWDGKQYVKASVVSSGNKKLYKIRLSNGQIIESSPDHKFLIATPHNTYTWKTAEELRIKSLGFSIKNYRIVLTNSIPEWSFPYTIPSAVKGSSNNARLIDLNYLVDKVELGEFLGRLASDGGYRISNSTGSAVTFIVAEHEKSILSKIEVICNKLCKSTTNKTIKPGLTKSLQGHLPVYKVEIYSSSLAKQLDDIKIKTQIPEFVWKDSKLLGAYLRGLFDGDGGVHPDGAVLTWGKGNTHELWARQIQEALLLFGIRSRLRIYPSLIGGSIRLQIQKYDMPLFCKLIGFINPIKQEKAESIIGVECKGTAKYGRAVSVDSVENTGTEVPMFDVINSSTERFMTGGVVVHNSNADMLKDALRRIYLKIRGGKPNGPKLYDARLLLVVHDEIVMMVADKDVEAVSKIVEEAMMEAYTAIIGDCIPNKVDVVAGQSWEKA